jgi:hypothetical protein
MTASALNRGRVWDVPVSFRARNTSIKAKNVPGSYGWMAHETYVRCVMFGSASSFASTIALARSIEGACVMSPYLSAL